MIAREWKARATAENAARYREHFAQRVLPVLRGVGGYAGGTLLTRTTGEEIEIAVVTRWESLDAIRAFAGEDLEQAVVADEIIPLLRDWDRRVRHYEIVLHEVIPPRP
jgi:heme-degrading monooxygenase HmoA